MRGMKSLLEIFGGLLAVVALWVLVIALALVALAAIGIVFGVVAFFAVATMSRLEWAMTLWGA